MSAQETNISNRNRADITKLFDNKGVVALSGNLFLRAKGALTQKPSPKGPGNYGIIVLVMNQIYNKNYTLIRSGYQLKLPLNLESIIASDDKVLLLSQFVEELDLTDLYRTYDRVRKSSATPKQMLKEVLYILLTFRCLQRLCKTCMRRTGLDSEAVSTLDNTELFKSPVDSNEQVGRPLLSERPRVRIAPGTS